jgi:hypothetical protein
MQRGKTSLDIASQFSRVTIQVGVLKERLPDKDRRKKRVKGRAAQEFGMAKVWR